MSARQATTYVRAFNEVLLAKRLTIWAIALPVAVRYEGEPVPGQRLELGTRREK